MSGVEFPAYLTWLGASLAQFQSLAIPLAGITLPIPPAPVTGFGGLDIHISNPTNPITVAIEFMPAFALTQQIAGPNPWTLPAGMNLDVMIPVSGQFAQVILTATSAPAVAGVYIAPARTDTAAYRFTTANPETMQVNATVAANGSHISPLAALVAGPCWAFCWPHDATAMLNFDVITLTPAGGFFKRLWQFGAPVAPAGQLLQLPAEPCGIRVVNNDGAASHNYDMGLVPQLPF